MKTQTDGMRSLVLRPAKPDRAALAAAVDTEIKIRRTAEAELKHIAQEGVMRSAVEVLMKQAPETDVYDWLIQLMEKPMLEALAEQCGGCQTAMARRLNMMPAKLTKRLKAHGVKVAGL